MLLHSSADKLCHIYVNLEEKEITALHQIHMNLQYCSQVWSIEKQVPLRGSEGLITSALMILGYIRLLYNPVTTTISLQNYRINIGFNNPSKSLHFYRRFKQTNKKSPAQLPQVQILGKYQSTAIWYFYKNSSILTLSLCIFNEYLAVQARIHTHILHVDKNRNNRHSDRLEGKAFSPRAQPSRVAGCPERLYSLYPLGFSR